MECPSGEVHGDAPPIDRMCAVCGNLLSIHPDIFDDETASIFYQCPDRIGWVTAERARGEEET
jgi:hypothetical protein